MNEQSDTFEHLSGGWHKAQARRWINPDGSQGGIVATRSRVNSTAWISKGASVMPGAQIGQGVRIHRGASVGHNTEIGCFTDIGWKAVIADDVAIGMKVLIGMEAFVDTGVSVGRNTVVGQQARIGEDRVIDEYGWIGEGVHINENDWLHVVGPLGFDQLKVTTVHSEQHGLRWWIGTDAKGVSTEEFSAILIKRFFSVPSDYKHLITYITTHPDVMMREAQRAQRAEQALKGESAA